MKEIKAGAPAELDYILFKPRGAQMDDVDVSALSYSIYDVTNAAEVRASTALTANATGTISLAAADTQLNGTGTTREKRRLCLVVNTNEYWDNIVFWVVAGPCDPT